MKEGAQRTRIRKGDLVRVTTGKEKGKEGAILKVLPLKHSFIVEGLNLQKRATKPTQSNPKGGIMEREGKLHFSNVMLLCGSCGKGTRVGTKVLPDGKKLRTCNHCGDVLDKES